MHVTIAWKSTCKKEMQPSNCNFFRFFTFFQHVCARLKMKENSKLHPSGIGRIPFELKGKWNKRKHFARKPKHTHEMFVDFERRTNLVQLPLIMPTILSIVAIPRECFQFHKMTKIDPHSEYVFRVFQSSIFHSVLELVKEFKWSFFFF